MFGDADVIFIVQKLRSVNPDVEIYTELVNPASMAFLNPIMPFTGFGDVSPLLMPPFTSGQVSTCCGCAAACALPVTPAPC